MWAAEQPTLRQHVARVKPGFHPGYGGGFRAIRRVLVHIHIYKNAGSSIDRLLWESFGDGFAILDTEPGHQTIDARAFARYLAENPHIKAVSSHRLHPPLTAQGALPIVFLRHPVDRAKSAYGFARMNADMPDHAVAREASFPEYVAWSLATRGEGAILRNHQVHHLSSAAYRADDPENWRATEADLSEAKALIAGLPVFGLVRQFRESCRLLNAQYKPHLPAVTFRDWAENVSSDPGLSEDAALAAIRAELGDAAYTALHAANALDLELYAFAKVEFERRMRGLDRPFAQLAYELKLLVGRTRQRLSGRGKGIGSQLHPLEPAYVRLSPWVGN